MSLINDALNQARKAPPRNPPSALPPFQPAADEAAPVTAWLLAVMVILLAVAATFSSVGPWRTTPSASPVPRPFPPRHSRSRKFHSRSPLHRQ